MAANSITSLHEKSAHEVEVKKKNFRWTLGMIEDLINCLADYKAKMEYQSLDFDSDRLEQIKKVKMEMANNYQNGEFGPVTVTELSVDEKSVYLKSKKRRTFKFKRATSTEKKSRKAWKLGSAPK